MNQETFIAAVVAVLAGAALALLTRRAVLADDVDLAEPEVDEPDQDTGLLDSLMVAASPSTYTPVTADADTAEANTRAFLNMIAYSEGTSRYPDDGYRTLFGGGQFASYADHPRIYKSFTDGAGRQLKTSAAGRYQFLAKTWDELKRKLGLQDFSPASQDAACLELIRQRGALNDVKSGRLQDAVAKCAPIWASLPGAGYDQPERKFGQLLAAYTNSGGSVA